MVPDILKELLIDVCAADKKCRYDQLDCDVNPRAEKRRRKSFGWSNVTEVEGEWRIVYCRRIKRYLYSNDGAPMTVSQAMAKISKYVDQNDYLYGRSRPTVVPFECSTEFDGRVLILP